MFLKNIEIFGFKSFPNRTKIELAQGISALIGPNGCGKSNIVDSLKWVLGEQSSRTLRASRMEDVIFNGTETRKALNVAEVTLTLINDKGILPIDLPEIAVKRRLYRTGESEYYINNQLVKLKEMRELFYDTGIGKSAYSIMEQGKIDQILSTKPEERRYIFEEAAGITKYKMKSQEAERKIEKTEENLKQVEGILKEVKRNHDVLKAQADKTLRYRELKTTLFDLEVDIQLLKLKEMVEARTEKEQVLNNQNQTRNNIQTEIDEINRSMEQNIDLVNSMEAKLIENQKKLYGIEIEKNNKVSQIRIFNERINELTRKIEYDRNRENSIKEKIQALTVELQEKEQFLADTGRRIEEVLENIRNFERDIELFNQRIKQNDKEISDNESLIQEEEKEIEVLQVELRKITDDIVTQLDQKLKETGYSMSERQKTEDSIQEIINSLKIQLGGKANILNDLGKLQDVKGEEFDKILNSTTGMMEELAGKLDKLSGLFDFYKKATPSFIDEFLAPEGIITQKREIDNRITTKQGTIAEKRERNKALREENRNFIKKIEEYRKTLGDLNVNKAQMQTQKSSLENEIRRVRSDIGEQQKLLDENTREINETLRRLEEIKAQIHTAEEEKNNVEKQEQELVKVLSSLENDISSKNKYLVDNEKKLKDRMGILLKQQTRIEKLQMELTETNVEIRNVYSNFHDRHSRDLSDYEVRMYEIKTPLNELKAQMDKHRVALKECGQVNLMAVEEYQEVKERYDFLNKQVEDLQKAREDLKRVTQEIHSESSELFLDTYTKIKKNFHIMFRRLFGGGRAELKLVDPANVLESGIEILAQPPGKKLESINLLSGGERSMTGVSMLFATFMVKPSPFCILDEIDAALDEENVSRFIAILDEFAHTSQFIIITHNKRTISGAETLLGITMEESGVSKIITVRIKGKEVKDGVGIEIRDEENPGENSIDTDDNAAAPEPVSQTEPGTSEEPVQEKIQPDDETVPDNLDDKTNIEENSLEDGKNKV